MKKSFDIKRYMRKADNRFSGFNGGGNDVNLYPGPSVESEWAMAEGAAPLKTPKPFMLNVSNSTGSDLTAVLFGLNTYLQTTNFGSDSGITVTPSSSNISYLQMIMQSGSQPFYTSLIRMRSTNVSQVVQTLDITFSDASGQILQDPVYAESYFSAYQYQDTIADIPYELKIDGNTSISVTILAGATVTFTFFPLTKVNVSKGLGGNNPLQAYGPPPVNLGGMQLPGRPYTANGAIARQ